MSMEHSEGLVISRTKNWIEKIVMGLNFCPFAAKPFKEGGIHYVVCKEANLKLALEQLMRSALFLDENNKIETLLIIFENSFLDFIKYLELLDLSEQLFEKEGYDGIYQIASFHPRYIFAGSNNEDPANYTNRSPYPMLHLLREESVAVAIEKHSNADEIPEKNIKKATDLGIDFFKDLEF